MHNAKGVNTPITSGQALTGNGSVPFNNTQLCKSIVGALQYTTITRLEITFSVNKVCQFMQNLLLKHWQAVKRILRYLAGTLDMGLIMKPNSASSLQLEAFCDVDWASDPEDRRSTSGFCVYLGSNLISWQSKRST